MIGSDLIIGRFAMIGMGAVSPNPSRIFTLHWTSGGFGWLCLPLWILAAFPHCRGGSRQRLSLRAVEYTVQKGMVTEPCQLRFGLKHGTNKNVGGSSGEAFSA